METPLAIANYFIKKSFDTGIEVTPMKLIKLVYIAHGWHLAFYDDPLLDEAVEAWQYGPVVPSVYRAFKSFGANRITSLGYTYNGFQPIRPELQDEGLSVFLDKVWDVYKGYTGGQLSTLTHQKGTPWDRVWSNLPKFCTSDVIPNNVIKEHYKQKQQESRRNG